MRKGLDKEMIHYAQELYEQGKTYVDIAYAINEKYGFLPHTDSIRYHVKRKQQSKMTKQERLKSDGITKTLVISDLHCPYHREDIVDIVEKHKNEIDTLIIGGDVIDCYAISSFKPLDPPPLISEMISCHQLLKQIQDLVPNAKRILIRGNHEARFEKYLANNKNELNKLHSFNILKEIVGGFEDNTDRQNGVVTSYKPLDYEVYDEWFYNDKGVITCHPTTFSRVAGKTCQMSLDYFVERGFDFDAILVAHTHKIASCIKYGKYAYEIGALCLPQGYAETGKLTYERMHNGYFLCVFKNGKYEPNLSKQYYL